MLTHLILRPYNGDSIFYISLPSHGGNFEAITNHILSTNSKIYTENSSGFRVCLSPDVVKNSVIFGISVPTGENPIKFFRSAGQK